MNGRRLCQIALACVAAAAMGGGGPALAAGHGGGGGGMHGGGGGMHGGGFHNGGGFHHDGFHRGHARVAFAVGGGWWGWPDWGWWGYPYDGWPDPYAYSGYYAPAAQYIEKGDDSDLASANAWWYRCDRPGGYYPYVKECPGGWQPVPARPPSP